MFLNSRKKTAIKELSNVFNQTAEMLASGDEYRKGSSNATRTYVPF